MKTYHFVLFILFSSLISCNNDDDCSGKQSPTLELTKDFLLSEKWFINEISYIDKFDFNGDGKIAPNLIDELQDCENDNFIIFEQNQSDFIVYKDGKIICNNFDDLHPSGADSYEIVNASQISFGFSLLGFGGFARDIFDAKAEISEDSSFKLIKGTATIIINNVGSRINYSLIARATDRP